MEEDMKLFKESVDFLKRISVTNNDDDPMKMEDCNILSEACEKVNGVHRDLPGKISSDTDFAYFIIQDSKSAVIKELNDVCDKLSDLSIKAGIQDYVASLQDDDDYISNDDAADVDVDDDDESDDDDDDDDAETSVYLQKKYIIALEIKHYDQTLEFMSELSTTAEKERVVEYDHDHLLLLKAYYAIKTVRDDLSCTSDVDVSSSEDLSLLIGKFRSQVEDHLNAIRNIVLNPTYKRDLSQHLVGFKEACLHLPNLPSQILDSSLDYTEWKRMSRRSVITTIEQKSKLCSVEADSGSGGCKTPINIPESYEVNDELCDIDYCYRNPNKCMEEEDEKYFPRVIRIGNWDPKYEGQGISLLDPSALRDQSEDELDLADMIPNIRLLNELLASRSPKFYLEDELDSTNMSEGSPKVHPEDDHIMHE